MTARIAASILGILALAGTVQGSPAAARLEHDVTAQEVVYRVPGTTGVSAGDYSDTFPA